MHGGSLRRRHPDREPPRQMATTPDSLRYSATQCGQRRSSRCMLRKQPCSDRSPEKTRCRGTHQRECNDDRCVDSDRLKSCRHRAPPIRRDEDGVAWRRDCGVTLAKPAHQPAVMRVFSAGATICASKCCSRIARHPARPRAARGLLRRGPGDWRRLPRGCAFR
jgi:hypothetical protein